MVQTEIPFMIHEHENNHESKKHLEENREMFSEKCERVLRLLRSGVRLTVYDALVKYDVSSLPRRIKDISDFYKNKNQESPIKSDWVKENGKSKYKEYYIESVNRII
jgi:hypothetical protein